MKAGTETKKEPKRYYYEETWEGEIEGGYSSRDFNDEEDGRKKDITWKRKGFEFFIGGGIYFGDKKTALYYNGAPENNINLNLLLNNKYIWDEVILIVRDAYPNIDGPIVLRDDFSPKSAYSIAMDIAFGLRYRIQKNWFIDLSYSFRRLSAESQFIFDFPEHIPGSVIKPSYDLPYSKWQYLMAREDRHYIDLSMGYIMQKHAVVKPFLSVGLLFTYTRINRFLAIIENKPFDLLQMARYPDYVPGIQEMPNYRDFAGPGYGFSLTLGLKIAANRMVSLDPIFQLSIANFGNNSYNLPGFDTSICFNYMVGVRVVMNDGLFSKDK